MHEKHDIPSSSQVAGEQTAVGQPRLIVHRTRGRRHGPITRLVSPSELGERIKPFVFLDHIDTDARSLPTFGFHPHSGIATLTLSLEGGGTHEDSTGAKGTAGDGDVEWMQAGGGVWHTGSATGTRIRGYQLWVALPPAVENAPARSQYVERSCFAHCGPARVILGELGGVRSPIDAPAPMNYFDVRLRAGDVWRYAPPAGHEVAWIAVHAGRVLTPQEVAAGELVVFEPSDRAITFQADEACGFVLGSAAHHPYPLVLGNYSVHTSADALERGEAGIRRIGDGLRLAGTLRIKEKQ